jgi:hypothetical protein
MRFVLWQVEPIRLPLARTPVELCSIATLLSFGTLAPYGCATLDRADELGFAIAVGSRVSAAAMCQVSL